jgi:hypothetical protein
MTRRAALAAAVLPFLPGRASSARVVSAAAAAPAAAASVSTAIGSGSPGHGDGQVNNPYGVVIGPEGALYFCDLDNQRIRRLDLRTRRTTDRRG